MGVIKQSTIQAGTVVNTDVAAGADIDSSKLEHENVVTVDFGYADVDGSIATDDYSFVMPAAGEILSVAAWVAEDGSNTDIDFDLHKNGSTILTGDINITNSTGNFTPVSGTISSGTFVAGDYITAKIETVTQNTGTQGPRLRFVYRLETTQ